MPILLYTTITSTELVQSEGHAAKMSPPSTTIAHFVVTSSEAARNGTDRKSVQREHKYRAFRKHWALYCPQLQFQVRVRTCVERADGLDET